MDICKYIHMHTSRNVYTCTQCMAGFIGRTVAVTSLFVIYIQGYQKVPETPLASCSVLKEEQEIWMDMQVCIYNT